MAEFDSIQVYLFLNGAWVDVSDDVQSGLTARWGIFGYNRDDLLADPGDMKFRLKNNSGEYYPDGSSPLSGFGANIQARNIFTYDGVSYTRFKGYVDKDGINFDIGKSTSNDFVKITAVDWMKFPMNAQIINPNIETDLTSDEAIEKNLEYIPINVSFTADTGDNTFPTIYDGIGGKTYAYSEFAKITYSESPGRLYLVKPRNTGELLVFENASHRENSHAQKQVATLTLRYWINQAGDYWLNQASDYWEMNEATETGAADVDLTSGIADIGLNYGENVVNRINVTASPKRIDTEPQILYRLPAAMPISNGQTIQYHARYTDPLGGANINAITSSMITPEVPGAPDPTLMILLNFTTDPIVDETGRQTITQNDVDVWNDIYKDGFGDVYISGGILGNYAVFGGYSAYQLTAENSNDFDFGSDAFTLGWFENKINITAGNTTMGRTNATYPPWLLGVVNGAGSNSEIYMSSNGTSWDIADGKSFGQVSRAKWVYYELSRDTNGWFYAFQDGSLTDSWYSALAFPTGANRLTIGRTQSSNYAWMGFDAFFIRKGVCLHTTDFEVPTKSLSPTNEGDYLMNTAEDGTGTDLSDGLSITAVYYSDGVDYTLINNSGSDGYITRLQARGRGVYSYDAIDYTANDVTSQNNYGIQPLSITQKYQQNLAAGTTWADSILSDEKDPRTELREVSFWANASATHMKYFLQCDVGDLVYIQKTDKGIDGYYYIQNVKYSIVSGVLVYVTWGVVPGLQPV